MNNAVEADNRNIILKFAASIDHRTSDLEFPHSSTASSTHELNAWSVESSSAETESTESESKESAESTDESATRDQIVSTHSRSPAESNPCDGQRHMVLNIPPSSLADQRTYLNKTHLRNELLPLKHLAENLYDTTFAVRHCKKKSRRPNTHLPTQDIESSHDNHSPSQVAASLLCQTEAVIRQIGDEVKLMTRLERTCRRHLTKERRQLLHPLRDLELLHRTTHCSIYNSLGGDPAQLCRGHLHKNSDAIARGKRLASHGRHHCGLWQCKIADDILSSLKQLIETFEDKLPHQTIH